MNTLPVGHRHLPEDRNVRHPREAMLLGRHPSVLRRLFDELMADGFVVKMGEVDAPCQVVVGGERSPRVMVIVEAHEVYPALMSEAPLIVLDEHLAEVPTLLRLADAGLKVTPAAAGLRRLLTEDDIRLLVLTRRGATEEQIGAEIGFSRRQVQRLKEDLCRRLGSPRNHLAVFFGRLDLGIVDVG